MPQTIAAIYRYPVKGLSPEPLGSVALTPGKCLPQDRRFAIALPSTRFDPERPEWLSKTHFVMLMRDEQLAELTTRFDAEADLLTIERHGRTVLRESLRDALGLRLHGVFQAHAPSLAATEQILEARRVLRRGDDEDVADAGEHAESFSRTAIGNPATERGTRIIGERPDHRDGLNVLSKRKRLRRILEQHDPLARSEAAGDDLDGPTLAAMFRAQARAVKALEKDPTPYVHYLVAETGGLLEPHELQTWRLLHAAPQPYTRERFDDTYKWTVKWNMTVPTATYENTVDNRAWE